MTEPTEPENKTKALAKVETSVCGLVLHNLEDMKTVAQLILQSGLAPDSFDTAEKIFVGLQTGAEVGLKPMQALNSIVVIKGSPRLWGDSALALVKRSGLCEYCKEYFELAGKKISEKDIQYSVTEQYPDELVAVCETKAHRDAEPVISYFSVADAKLARLWDKKSKKGGIMPWSTHPKRMLKYKARAFNLRDNFPDVLYGMHLAEEMYGEEPLPAPETDVKPRENRRMAVPSTAVDTTRAPAEKDDDMKGFDANGPGPEEKPAGESTASETTIEAPDETPETPAGEKPEPELVTYLCKECGQTFQMGKECKGIPCGGCGKGLLVEVEEQPEPEEALSYREIVETYKAQNPRIDFIEFAAFVLCIDEDEVGSDKLTIEQLQQVKAYIETSGVAIT